MSGDVRVGLDVGGTFTDLVCWDGGTGRFTLRKVPTTPADIAAGILQALAATLPPGAPVAEVAHGTTVATKPSSSGRGRGSASSRRPASGTCSSYGTGAGAGRSAGRGPDESHRGLQPSHEWGTPATGPAAERSVRSGPHDLERH
jgi:hypothetical protein